MPKIGELATRLVDEGNDGLVVNGTTGESPTTTDAEKDAIIRATRRGGRRPGDRGRRRRHLRHRRTRSTWPAPPRRPGRTAPWWSRPYYSRPQQAGLIAHFTAVADATELPVMLYDIPPRSVVAIEPDTLLRLGRASADHRGQGRQGRPVRRVAKVIANSDLTYYSGDDPLTLPWMSIGAVGIVSIISHVVGPHVRAHGRRGAGPVTTPPRARSTRRCCRPTGRMGRTGGGAGSGVRKNALRQAGFDVGDPRLPQIPATREQAAQIAADLAELSLSLGSPRLR